MKTATVVLALGLLAGCSSPTDEPVARAPAESTETASPTPDVAPASTDRRASATGVVESVDPATRTVTIAHGPVPELQWPAMTMTFQAPDADLSAIEQGDQVSFELTASGMDGTITSITSR